MTSPMSLIPRHLSDRIARGLRAVRILNLVGPRQGGKSTLVRDMLPSAAYITLDDVLTRRALSADAFGPSSSTRSRFCRRSSSP